MADTFSILVRIDVVVTLLIDIGGEDEADFQYPRTDRCRCNPSGMETPGFAAERFQYPRTDRCRCNSAIASFASPAQRTFSILVRIDVVVTPTAR